MNDSYDLNRLIEKYYAELIDIGSKYGHPSNITKEEQTEAYDEPTPTEITDDAEETDNMYSRNEMPVSPVEPQETETENNILTEAVVSNIPEENPVNFATFKALVFAAEGALPVEGAKVTVKRKDELHAFLITNGSGETKTVKLSSFPEENSLEPLNPDKEVIYTADISADGFERKRDLPVYAVGGSDIILQQFLVPLGGV